MENQVSIEHLKQLCEANGVKGKKVPKAIVFELSHYDSNKGLNLIICLENVSGKFQLALKFRDSAKLDGFFSFEYDAIVFAKDKGGDFLLFKNDVVKEGLPNTLEVFEAFAASLGYSHCKSMGIFPGDKKRLLFHVWMGNQLA